MKKGNRTILVTLFVVVVAFSLLGFNSFSRLPVQQLPSQDRNVSSNAARGTDEVPCINPNLPVPAQYHIHPHLRIVSEGVDVTIPAQIGITSACERVLHTHDASGTIHVEPNFYAPYTLGDFFRVWGEPLSPDHVMGFVRDADHEIVMRVNGTPSDAFGNLVLQDKQEIVIEHKRISE